MKYKKGWLKRNFVILIIIILNIAFYILLFGIFKANIYTIIIGNYVLDIGVYIIVILIDLIIIFIYFLVLVKNNVIIRKIRNFIIFTFIAAISLFVAYFIYDHFRENTPITQGEALTFYGEYITFLGAFSLGYFLYIKEKKRLIEDKKGKCKLLLSCIEKAEIDMSRIVRYKYETNRIFYDVNWRQYYLEFESLTKRKYSNIKHTLDEFFDTIEIMNMYLERDEAKKAQIIYENHIDYNCYSTRKYNMLETKLIILDATYINENSIRFRQKPWDEKANVKKEITEFTKKFYDVVENYVYNYMIKNNITNIEINKINNQLVDWLLTNPKIKEIAEWPDQKRIVTQIVFNISLYIDKKSNRLSYCWAEFRLKK